MIKICISCPKYYHVFYASIMPSANKYVTILNICPSIWRFSSVYKYDFFWKNTFFLLWSALNMLNPYNLVLIYCYLHVNCQVILQIHICVPFQPLHPYNIFTQCSSMFSHTISRSLKYLSFIFLFFSFLPFTIISSSWQ